MGTDVIDLDDPTDEYTEARHERAFSRLLCRHPDCRDPDHPGCERCEERDYDKDYDKEWLG